MVVSKALDATFTDMDQLLSSMDKLSHAQQSAL